MRKQPKHTLAPFVVRAARGHMTSNGGAAYSGMLYKGDVQVASFGNAGNGGCTDWNVRDAQLFAEFKAEAVAKFVTVKFEHEDWYVGELWDAAYLKASA